MRKFKKNLKMMISAFVCFVICLMSGRRGLGQEVQAAAAGQAYAGRAESSHFFGGAAGSGFRPERNIREIPVRLMKRSFLKRTVCRLRSPCREKSLCFP